MIELKGEKVLVLAPHTDDAEFGCGGTISKLIESNNEVYVVAFSACQQSVLKQFPPDILITEVKEASAELGLPQSNLILLDYAVRTFNYNRQEILDDLLRLKHQINPSVVFMPPAHDLHQDHSTISQEGLRAFKFCNILCYELPWNNISFRTSCFLILTENHIQNKVNAILKYRSQAHRNYSNEEFVRSLARVRGTQINEQYAECFELLRIKL